MAASRISQKIATIDYGLPEAFILAKFDDVLANPSVLYNLVQPCKNNPTMMESVNGLVNVVPRGRLYRMDGLEEMDSFRSELLQRPTVLQPVISSARGWKVFGGHVDCTIRNVETNYLLLVNQLHPKVLGRLQMGMDLLRINMRRSVSSVFQLSFDAMLERLYYKLTHAIELPRTVISCKSGDIVMWSASSSYNIRGSLNEDQKFRFEDISINDIKLRTLADAVQQGSTAASTSSAIQSLEDMTHLLRGWSFVGSQSGDSAAARSRYSYASASQMILQMSTAAEVDETMI